MLFSVGHHLLFLTLFRVQISPKRGAKPKIFLAAYGGAKRTFTAGPGGHMLSHCNLLGLLDQSNGPYLVPHSRPR